MSLLEENIKNQKWPKKELRVFNTDFDRWNQASLDYYRAEEKLSIYAEGYKEAGDIVTRWINDNRILRDALVYPIVFLYRQYIELVLKDIIGSVNKKETGEYEFPKHHKIMDLWKEANALLVTIKIETSSEDLLNVENILKQFDEHDSSSEAFRYPFYTDGSPIKINLRNINIRNLSEVVDALHSYFFGIQCVIGEAQNSIE